MTIFRDFESLFEKFSVITVDGHLTDSEALRQLREKTTPELFIELQKKLLEISLKK